MNTPRDLWDFEGTWAVAREILDRRAGRSGRFEGRAAFSRDGAGLAYAERGRLAMAGGPVLAAERRYLWRPAGAGRVAVTFADGRAFHEIALGETAEAAHLCAPDSYRVTYAFAAWPAWSTVWEVRGPCKDLGLVTRYHRD